MNTETENLFLLILCELSSMGRAVTLYHSAGVFTRDYLFRHGNCFEVYNSKFVVQDVIRINIGNLRDDDITIYLKGTLGG